MSTLTSGDLVMRFRLYSVDEVRELDGILDEKDRNVIPNDIPIALLCVEFNRKPSNIANRVLRKSALMDVSRIY